MAFPQPSFAAPFPDQQQPHHSYGQQQQGMGWASAPQGQDQGFYSPPQAQQGFASQPQQMPYGAPMPHADSWNQSGGARMRPLQSPGGSLDPSAVAFMPTGVQNVMQNPVAGMAYDIGKASFAKNVSAR